MTESVNRASAIVRQTVRSSSDTRLTEPIAPATSSTRKPETPSSMISGSAPIRQAMIGVPAARLSTATSPNGSCQRSGITIARALPRSRQRSSRSNGPRYSTSLEQAANTFVSKNSRCRSSAIPARRNGRPAARAVSMARSGPFREPCGRRDEIATVAIPDRDLTRPEAIGDGRDVVELGQERCSLWLSDKRASPNIAIAEDEWPVLATPCRVVTIGVAIRRLNTNAWTWRWEWMTSMLRSGRLPSPPRYYVLLQTWIGPAGVQRGNDRSSISRAEVADPAAANSVTSWPIATSCSVRSCATLSQGP